MRRRGIRDERLLCVLAAVPRHLFVPRKFRDRAYRDEPLPIGCNQTISQPYIVAYMIEQLQLTGSEKVLEIGTGSGYQTAILSELGKEVFTVEIIPALAEAARRTLQRLGRSNIRFRVGDGRHGWPEEAPFDAIVVSAAPTEIPPELIAQLQVGGRMAIPVGGENQELYLVTRSPEKVEWVKKIPVRFVPLTGEADCREDS